PHLRNDVFLGEIVTAADDLLEPLAAAHDFHDQPAPVWMTLPLVNDVALLHRHAVPIMNRIIGSLPIALVRNRSITQLINSQFFAAIMPRCSFTACKANSPTAKKTAIETMAQR